MNIIGIHSYNLADPRNEFFNSYVTFYHLFCFIGLSINDASCAYIFLHLPNVQIEIELNFSFFLTLNQDEYNIYWQAEQMCRRYSKKMVSYILAN